MADEVGPPSADGLPPSWGPESEGAPESCAPPPSLAPWLPPSGVAVPASPVESPPSSPLELSPVLEGGRPLSSLGEEHGASASDARRVREQPRSRAFFMACDGAASAPTMRGRGRRDPRRANVRESLHL